jgi:hypothetical protein
MAMVREGVFEGIADHRDFIGRHKTYKVQGTAVS